MTSYHFAKEVDDETATDIGNAEHFPDQVSSIFFVWNGKGRERRGATGGVQDAGLADATDDCDTVDHTLNVYCA